MNARRRPLPDDRLGRDRPVDHVDDLDADMDIDLDDALDDDRDEVDDDLDDDRHASRRRPRTGLKRSVLGAIRQLPSYLKLLFGLFRDSRVSRLDRLLVLGALAYIISPLDFVPDVIPFFGEVDDLFLLVLALQRLVENAGRRVVMDHWRGAPDELDDLNLSQLLSALSFFLPPMIRRRLRKMAKR